MGINRYLTDELDCNGSAYGALSAANVEIFTLCQPAPPFNFLKSQVCKPFFFVYNAQKCARECQTFVLLMPIPGLQ